MSNRPFYRAQAADQQVAADSATLANVRDRSQRAANAWTDLADRLERSETQRESRAIASRDAAAATDSTCSPRQG